ncbi:hypothetical protein V5799_027115 [Amblyomma americanum]|uniref:Uncharacterized protein n=1 Tax=Amblyomma americanum TaxID=6943 RepID=A0AAQ4DGN0_AMBAM
MADGRHKQSGQRGGVRARGPPAVRARPRRGAHQVRAPGALRGPAVPPLRRVHASRPLPPPLQATLVHPLQPGRPREQRPGRREGLRAAPLNRPREEERSTEFSCPYLVLFLQKIHQLHQCPIGNGRA